MTSIYSIQLNGNYNASKTNSVKLLLSSLGIFALAASLIVLL